MSLLDGDDVVEKIDKQGGGGRIVTVTAGDSPLYADERLPHQVRD